MKAQEEDNMNGVPIVQIYHLEITEEQRLIIEKALNAQPRIEEEEDLMYGMFKELPIHEAAAPGGIHCLWV
jgi:hypothetical protein